jgi:transposase
MGMPIGQKIDGEALRDRRLAARKLLDEGVAQAEVARRLKVSRQSVSRWADAPTEQLEAICRFGRKSTIDGRLLGRLRHALLAGAKRQGFSADVWPLPRVRGLIVKLGGPSFSTVHVWRLLGRMGFSPQRPTGRARRRNEEAIAAWKTQEWPRIEKKP